MNNIYQLHEDTIRHCRVKQVIHRGEQRIAIFFKYDIKFISELKKIPGSRWSKTLSAWHVPNTLLCKKHLENLGIFVNEDNDKLKSREEKTLINHKISSHLKRYESYLKYKRYSDNTIRVYLSMIQVFLNYFKTNPCELTNEHIIKFNNEYILGNNFSFNYQNQMVSAIKLFFERVKYTKVDLALIERPKRPKTLPTVLSKTEVERLFKAVDNLKHKAVLALIYSAGLRVGEAINMKLVDIDSERNLIHIRSAKGNKDRVVTLSKELLKLLREYARTYKPKVYLFNGYERAQYTRESIRQVLQRTAKKAGIRKQIKVHTLRHSYATHLLEKGVDIRYIQDMLGHNDPKTTMIYTHVSQRKINTFINPFDELEL